MSDNTIQGLRAELFSTLRALRDPEKPLDIAVAKAVVTVADAIIDSARVEIDMARATQMRAGSGFIPLSETPSMPKPAAAPVPADTPASGTTVEPIPGGRRITHRA